MFSYFDLKLVLNHPLAADRWRSTVAELARVGINDYTRIEARLCTDPKESFNRSILLALQYFVLSGKDRLLFMEDDIVFKSSVSKLGGVLRNAIAELPDNWEILYLGANVHVGGFNPPLRHSPHLCRLMNAWTTHAVAFSRKGAARILSEKPPVKDSMFDGWLSDRLISYQAFCVVPMVAFQRAGKSLIWGNNVNYDPVFIESNSILLNSK